MCVPLHVPLHEPLCAHLHVALHLPLHIHLHIPLYVPLHIHLHLPVHINLYIPLHIPLQVYVCAHLHVPLHVAITIRFLWPRIIELYLQDNLLTAIPDSVAKMNWLRYLDVSQNMIAVFPKAWNSLRNSRQIGEDTPNICTFHI